MAVLPLLIPFFSFCVEICALITGLWVMSLLWRLLPFTRRLPIPPIHVCLNTHLPQLPSIPTSISPLSPPKPHRCSDLNNSHLTPTPTHDCLEMAWLFVLWMRLFNFRPQAEDKEPYNCCNKNELVPERKEVGMYALVSDVHGCTPNTWVLNVWEYAGDVSLSDLDFSRGYCQEENKKWTHATEWENISMVEQRTRETAGEAG